MYGTQLTSFFVMRPTPKRKKVTLHTLFNNKKASYAFFVTRLALFFDKRLPKKINKQVTLFFF